MQKQSEATGDRTAQLLRQHKNTAHTEWPDGRVHHTGVTVTLTPNTFVRYTTGGWSLTPTLIPGRKVETESSEAQRTQQSRPAVTTPALLTYCLLTARRVRSLTPSIFQSGEPSEQSTATKFTAFSRLNRPAERPHARTQCVSPGNTNTRKFRINSMPPTP